MTLGSIESLYYICSICNINYEPYSLGAKENLNGFAMIAQGLQVQVRLYFDGYICFDCCKKLLHSTIEGLKTC